MSVPVALPGALAYGVADFAGGLATRRAPVLTVTLVAQFAGLVALVPALWLLPGRPSGAALGIGAVAGVVGYRACCSTCAGWRWARWAWWRRSQRWSGRACRWPSASSVESGSGR